jgi:hypothetical protein
MEQPKDYIVEQMNKELEEAYAELPFYLKVIVKIQNHMFLTVLSSILLGYLAGMTYGKFW